MLTNKWQRNFSIFVLFQAWVTPLEWELKAELGLVVPNLVPSKSISAIGIRAVYNDYHGNDSRTLPLLWSLPDKLFSSLHRLASQAILETNALSWKFLRKSAWTMHTTQTLTWLWWAWENVYKGSGSRGRVRVHLRGGSQLFGLQGGGGDRCQTCQRGEECTLRVGSQGFPSLEMSLLSKN